MLNNTASLVHSQIALELKTHLDHNRWLRNLLFTNATFVITRSYGDAVATDGTWPLPYEFNIFQGSPLPSKCGNLSCDHSKLNCDGTVIGFLGQLVLRVSAIQLAGLLTQLHACTAPNLRDLHSNLNRNNGATVYNRKLFCRPTLLHSRHTLAPQPQNDHIHPSRS